MGVWMMVLCGGSGSELIIIKFVVKTDSDLLINYR
jgi:hypothetical protein